MSLGNWLGEDYSVQSFARWAVEFCLSAHEGTVPFLMNMKWFLALSLMLGRGWPAGVRGRLAHSACSPGLLQPSSPVR